MVRRENKAFKRRSVANAWIKQREKELAQPEALNELVRIKGARRKPTRADAIDRHIEDSQKQMGRTKTQVLRTIKDFDIADRLRSDINGADIVEFAREKFASGVQPQTVANCLSHLGAVFSIARPAPGLPARRSGHGRCLESGEAARYRAEKPTTRSAPDT